MFKKFIKFKISFICILSIMMLNSFNTLASYKESTGARNTMVDYYSSSYSRYTRTWLFGGNIGGGNLGGVQVTDTGDQIPAIATVNNIKMTQDDNNYYFNYDISYDNKNLIYSRTKRFGNGSYQTINDGSIYLSSIPINEIKYNYYVNLGSGEQSINRTGHLSSAVNCYGPSRTEYLNLSFNHDQYHSTQSATLADYYQNGYWTSYSTTSNDSEVPESNFTSLVYCTYNFPFYTISNRLWNFLNSYCKSIIWGGTLLRDILYVYPSGGLFINGQLNLTHPKKSSNISISQSINKDLECLYWNNTFSGKITVPKDEINDYRYVNMYAPTAMYTTYDGGVSQSNSGDTNSSSYTTNIMHYLGQGANEAISVHSANAIDLLNYTHCDHDWYFFEKLEGDKVNHIKKCRHCEWEIEEPHQMTKEYHGYHNNLCEICGYTDKVKIDIYEDDNTPIQHDIEMTSYETLPANFKNILDSYIKNITGYYLDGYAFGGLLLPKKPYSNTNTELEESNIKVKYHEFPERVASKSSILKLNYEPNEYYIERQAESNLGTMLFVTGAQEGPYYYDTEYPIPNPGAIGGAYFKGWSLTKKSTADYTTTFKNLTATRSEVVKLWPILRDQEFTFKFYNKSNYGHTLAEITPATYTAHDPVSLLPNNVEVPGYKFLGWSLTAPTTHLENGREVPDNFHIDFNPNHNVTLYSTIDGTEILVYPVYEPIKYNVEFVKQDPDNGWAIISTSSIICEYDKLYNVQNQEIATYYLAGYSLNDNHEANVVNIGINNQFINLTNIENNTVRLFPVLVKTYYNTTYRTTNNLNIPVTPQSLLYNNTQCWYNQDYDATFFTAGTDYPSCYNQIGWTLTSGSDHIDYITSFRNLSNENGKAVYLYPVFEAYPYNIEYKYFDKSLNATRSVIERVEVGKDKALLPILMVPLKDNEKGNWYINMPARTTYQIINSTKDIDQFVIARDDTITLEWVVTSKPEPAPLTTEDTVEAIQGNDFLNYKFFVDTGDSQGLYEFNVKDVLQENAIPEIHKKNTNIPYNKPIEENFRWSNDWTVTNPDTIRIYNGESLRESTPSNVH